MWQFWRARREDSEERKVVIRETAVAEGVFGDERRANIDRHDLPYYMISCRAL